MTAVRACPACGTVPEENARFCHGCGAPVAEAATHAEYKQVTVLFADLVRSMEIAAAVGAERWREIMADLADRSAAVVQRFAGTVDKFTGDHPTGVQSHAQPQRHAIAALHLGRQPVRLSLNR